MSHEVRRQSQSLGQFAGRGITQSQYIDHGQAGRVAKRRVDSCASGNGHMLSVH
jgi:hypothetical protein